MWKGTSPKKRCRGHMSIWKEAPCRILSGKCRFQQGDTTGRLSERPECRTRTPARAGEGVARRDAHSLLMGTQTGAAPRGHSLLASGKTKHSVTARSSDRIPCCSPRGAENVCPPKHCTQIFISSFIQNCQNSEASEMSFSRCWRHSLWSIQTMDYCSALKWNELTSHGKTWRKLDVDLKGLPPAWFPP